MKNYKLYIQGIHKYTYKDYDYFTHEPKENFNLEQEIKNTFVPVGYSEEDFPIPEYTIEEVTPDFSIPRSEIVKNLILKEFPIHIQLEAITEKDLGDSTKYNAMISRIAIIKQENPK